MDLCRVSIGQIPHSANGSCRPALLACALIASHPKVKSEKSNRGTGNQSSHCSSTTKSLSVCVHAAVLIHQHELRSISLRAFSDALCHERMSVGGTQKSDSTKYHLYKCQPQPGRQNCGRVAIGRISLERYVVDQALSFLSTAKLRPFEGSADLVELRRLIDKDDAALLQLNRKRFLLRTMTDDEFRADSSRNCELASKRTRGRCPRWSENKNCEYPH